MRRWETKTTWLVFLLWFVGIAIGDQVKRKPAVYFYDSFFDKYNSAVIQELLDDGFEVGKNKVTQVGQPWTLTWQTMTNFNVLVLVGLPNDFNKEQAALLDRFLALGGGLLVIPIANFTAVHWPPLVRWYYEDQLGFKIYIEQVKNPEKTCVYEAANGRIKYPCAWTDDIAKSPITQNVKTLWYPVDKTHFAYNTAPLWLSAEWTPLVNTGPGAFTRTAADGEKMHSYVMEAAKEFSSFKGREGNFPIVAVRERNPGCVAVIGVNPQLLLWSGYIPAFDGVLLKKGMQARPSDWAKLLINLYRYLAEPSLENGNLGGQVTIKNDVFSTPPGDAPIQFYEKTTFGPLPERVRVGIAGARSSLSSGKNSVAEWKAAAKNAGYDFLIFLEDLKKMNADKWLRLRRECRENTDPNFLAFPGVEFEMERGDRGFYLDDLGTWPMKRAFTKDGRVFSSRLAKNLIAKSTIYFREDMPLPTGLTAWYGKHMSLGHFSHATSPTPFWNHNLYQVLSVFSRENGKVLDRWTIDAYREVNAQKIHIAPFALELMNDIKALPKPYQKDSACLTYTGTLPELHDTLNELGSYRYHGLVSALFVSNGPRIREWNVMGSLFYDCQRWLAGPEEKDFYITPNYRIKMRLAVESAAGLHEIKIYDGMRLWRRFLANGKTSFDLVLDGLNDNHRHFIAEITDRQGRRAMTGEIETENWLNRIYWCADRCNFWSHPYGHNGSVPNPVYTSTLGPERMVLNRWIFPFWGPDCGLIQGQIDTMFSKAAYPDSMWSSFFDIETIPEYVWMTREYSWYQKHAKRFTPTCDYLLQGWDQTFSWPQPPSGNYPFYPYTEKEDDFYFKKEITFSADDAWSIAPLIQWEGILDQKNPGEYEFRLGEKIIRGTIPADQLKVNRQGPLPSQSIIALRLNGIADEKQTAYAGTAIINGAGLQYHLQVTFSKDGPSIKFQVGWQENGKTVAAGTRRSVKRFIVGNDNLAHTALTSMYLAREFSGPDAGFNSALLDRLTRADWYKVGRGSVVDKMLPLKIAAADYAAAIAIPEVIFPINSVPIIISGLNANWTTYYHECGSPLRRPIAVSPDGEARVQFDRRKKNVTVWVGHPVICSHTEIHFDLIDAGKEKFIIEANNVGDQDLKVTFQPNKDCPFLRFEPQVVAIAAGGHVSLSL